MYVLVPQSCKRSGSRFLVLCKDNERNPVAFIVPVSRDSSICRLETDDVVTYFDLACENPIEVYEDVISNACDL